MADNENRGRLIYGLGLVLVLLSIAKAGGIATSNHIDGDDLMVVLIMGLMGAFLVGYGKWKR